MRKVHRRHAQAQSAPSHTGMFSRFRFILFTYVDPQKWTGTFFSKHSLFELGLRIQVGHPSGTCPNPSPSRRPLLVGDLNGLHFLTVDYCGCMHGGSPDRQDYQLLRHRIFPVTLREPRTAFTFNMLELFHELTLQGKTTAYDFYRSVERRTDNLTLAQTVSSHSTLLRLWAGN